MMKRLSFYFFELISSFWLLPSFIVLLLIGAAAVAIQIDNNVTFEYSEYLRFILPGSTKSATQVLTVISGAMIGVASTVFSITLVALNLAYTQFGSQLIKNFMHERINQVVLGSYIATYIYCLIVLNTIKEGSSIEFLPTFSVLLAIIFSIVNIILLIFYIHNTSTSIQSEKVIEKIYNILTNNIKHLFFEEQVKEKKEHEEPDLEKVKRRFSSCQKIKAPNTGYMEFLNFKYLYDTAKEKDLLLIIHYKIGDFLVKGTILLEVYSHESLSKKELNKLQDKFIIRSIRTLRHDPKYSFHQITQIAARALSPGINDPFTANACIDKLAAIMCKVTDIKFSPPYQYDHNDNLRIISTVFTFEGMMGAAFNQIRQYSENNPSVSIRLMEAFSIIYEHTSTDLQKESVIKHAKMVLRMAENTYDEPNDLEDLKERSKFLDS